MSAYSQASTRTVAAANGIEYAYREVGEGGVPLVLLTHFRGNLDNWDRALVDALAGDRRVIAFDNAGVGGSSGATPSTVAQMALDAIAFIEALSLEQVDILRFSLGSFVTQDSPAASGLVGWAAVVMVVDGWWMGLGPMALAALLVW